MSKEEFLNFAKDQYCTTIMSLGPPFSGKTWIALKTIKQWIDMKMFDEYYVVLPSFRNEMKGSYDWMEKIPNMHIYESIRHKVLEDLIVKCEKNNELFKKGKLKVKPRYFFFCDDATSQGKGLFSADVIRRLVTENRHLNIHSWFCLHYDKGILDPKVRSNIFFVFLYKVKDVLLKKSYEEYVTFDEFDDYKQFKEFWKEYVSKNKFGCLLIKGKDSYNPNVCNWYEPDK